MPKLDKTESKGAAASFEQLPPGKVQRLISLALKHGDGIMFGQTRNGKATIINIYSDAGKERSFAEGTEQLIAVIDELTIAYELS